jgi:hypothetical protein
MTLNYSIIAQSAEEVRDIQNSPSISMWPYLLNSAQTALFNQTSVYVEAGKTSKQLRFLYMNTVAFGIWKKMGRPGTLIGELHRPPKLSTLAFGTPFSE